MDSPRGERFASTVWISGRKCFFLGELREALRSEEIDFPAPKRGSASIPKAQNDKALPAGKSFLLKRFGLERQISQWPKKGALLF